MSGRTFSGQDLAKALQAGEFEQPGLVLTGMVKPSEQKGHVAFARGGCDTWVDLPTSMIEQAEHVGSRPCEDHSHPVFRITLKESDDPQAKLLGQLLSAQPDLGRPVPPPPSSRVYGPRGSARMRPGLHDPCLYLCDALVRECISLGGNYEACLSLRATCSDICGVISVFDPIFF
jgi:hypothetical protein